MERGGEKEERRGGGKRRHRVSHRRPSVAVCFLVLSSFMQRDWMDSESKGAASWRSRSFCWIPKLSDVFARVVERD